MVSRGVFFVLLVLPFFPMDLPDYTFFLPASLSFFVVNLLFATHYYITEWSELRYSYGVGVVCSFYTLHAC